MKLGHVHPRELMKIFCSASVKICFLYIDNGMVLVSNQVRYLGKGDPLFSIHSLYKPIRLKTFTAKVKGLHTILLCGVPCWAPHHFKRIHQIYMGTKIYKKYRQKVVNCKTPINKYQFALALTQNLLASGIEYDQLGVFYSYFSRYFRLHRF